MDITRLSPSGLRLLQLCGEAFRRRYVEGQRTTYGTPVVIGNATHDSAEVDLTLKVDEGSLMVDEAVPDIASDAFERAWSNPEFELDADQAQAKAKVKADSKDLTIELAKLHHQTLAPVIQPALIEERLDIEVPGFPLRLVGYADVIETDGAIRDLKTRGKRPRQQDVDDDLGLALYAMGVEVAHGTRPPSIGLDVLVKTKTPTAVSVFGEPATNHEPLLRRIERAALVIEAGAYLPAEPGHWKCSEKFCDYYDDCPWGKVRRTQI